jgi:chromosome segregation ATPase
MNFWGIGRRESDMTIDNFMMAFTKMYDQKITSHMQQLSEKIDDVVDHLTKIEIAINTLEAQSRKTEELVAKHDIALSAMQTQVTKNCSEIASLQKTANNWNKAIASILITIAGFFIINNLNLSNKETSFNIEKRIIRFIYHEHKS